VETLCNFIWEGLFQNSTVLPTILNATHRVFVILSRKLQEGFPICTAFLFQIVFCSSSVLNCYLVRRYV